MPTDSPPRWKRIARDAIGPYALLVTGILALMVLVLHGMGRAGWCTYGFGLWTSDAWGFRTSQDFADPYSFTHLLHGVIFYWLLTLVAKKSPVRARWILAMLLEAGWEILENSPLVIDRYRAMTASMDYYGDSILNSVGDVLFCGFGFWMASRLPPKVSVAMVVVVELVLLVAIRDNLTLNILMLFAPMEAVKHWQLGGF